MRSRLSVETEEQGGGVSWRDARWTFEEGPDTQQDESLPSHVTAALHGLLAERGRAALVGEGVCMAVGRPIAAVRPDLASRTGLTLTLSVRESERVRN